MVMKVVDLAYLLGTDREVHCPTPDICTSYRMLVKDDGMGFSLNYTKIPRGKIQHWHYKNHLEACYCISGVGILISLETGEKHTIGAGVLYALEKHDNHTFQAIKDTVLISIFNPPLVGNEVHDEEGSYPLEEEENA